MSLRKLMLFFGIHFLCLQIKAQVEQIPINSLSEISEIRAQIRESIFGTKDSVFLTEDTTSSSLMSSEIFSSTSLREISVSKVVLQHGFVSRIYHFKSTKSNGLNIPILYHSGHNLGTILEDQFVNDSGDYSISVVDFFLAKGFDVYGIDLPLVYRNNAPAFVTEDGVEMDVSNHDRMFQLRDPLYYFMAPVKAVVDHLQATLGATEFVMTGLSGGGWATTVYSALDPRITMSFPVAGTLPIPLRRGRDVGDGEQEYRPFYNRFNYSTLYFLGGAGLHRMQVQILNKFDHCCFAWNGNNHWVPEVRSAFYRTAVPGAYQFIFDTLAPFHKISSAAVDTMWYYISEHLIKRVLLDDLQIIRSSESDTICAPGSLNVSVSSRGTNKVKWIHVGSNQESESAGINISQSGTYQATIQNLTGVQVSALSMSISEVKTQTPFLYVSNGVLYSNIEHSILWYLNGQPIRSTGESGIQLKLPGEYAARMRVGHCESNMSEPFIFGTSVYPNPARSFVEIRIDRSVRILAYEIWTLHGYRLQQGQIGNAGRINLNNRIRSGIYILALRTETGDPILHKLVVRD